MTQVTRGTRVADHGGGVHAIEVPIPDNPLGHTLVYVVDTDRGPVLVDTGWDDPASWDTLTDGLRRLGTDVADIHGVVLTHHHPDHHGLSGRVREASGAWLAMHAADTAVVRRTREAEPGAWLAYLTEKLTAVGAPEDHLAPLRAARARGSGRSLPGMRAALPDREIVPGDLLPSPADDCGRSGPPGIRRVTSASTWRSGTRRAARATAACSRATTCCRGSRRTSACTRTPTTRR